MKRFAVLAIGLTLLLIIVFNVQGWLILHRTNDLLRAELGNRLQGVALMLARSVSGRPDSPENLRLLSQVAQDHRLFNVFIVNESLEYLFNLRDAGRVGATDPSLEPDAGEILAAFSGIPTQSQLYTAGDYYLASAYAPLESAAGMVSAVLGVEADARYFGTLRRFRSSFLLINGFSLLAIVTITVVLLGLVRHTLRLEQAAARVNSLALMGQLTAAVAHEIKNPLGIIRAAAERLQLSTARSQATTAPELQYITDEIDRLNHIISNYLSLGRSQPAQIELLNLNELITEIVGSVEHELRRTGISVELNLSPLPAVTGNRLQLRQAFLNLVLNAIQAQPGGGRLQINGRIHAPGGRRQRWAVIEIVDNGPGISPEHRHRVFEPFFTTREKGSGLGLFVVRQVIEAHQGRVAIRESSASGTTVEVRLRV